VLLESFEIIVSYLKVCAEQWGKCEYSAATWMMAPFWPSYPFWYTLRCLACFSKLTVVPLLCFCHLPVCASTQYCLKWTFNLELPLTVYAGYATVKVVICEVAQDRWFSWTF